MYKNKYKILFIHSQLVQHGSERYLFELCKSLNKDLFEIGILTRFFNIKNNYYYPKLIQLGCKIDTRLISKRYLNYFFRNTYNNNIFIKKITNIFFNFINLLINKKYLNKFDLIIVIGIETYCDTVSPLLDSHSNVIIHHVTHKFQFNRNYYLELNQNKIVINDDQQKDELSESILKNQDLFFLPLPMNFSDTVNLGEKIVFNHKEKIKIGIFSRLYKDRPNEPLFQLFYALSRKVSNVELYFYGSGDPDLYSNLLQELNIKDKVIFKGHSESIANSIIEDKITILWLVSMDKSISYSSIEIAALGMPMVFWNLSLKKSHNDLIKETNNALNSFNNIHEFVEYNQLILSDKNMLRENGQNLRNYVINYFDINNNIKDLEKYYLKHININ
jgi:glycosyltransferase involved in cell wall biosynthesis